MEPSYHGRTSEEFFKASNITLTPMESSDKKAQSVWRKIPQT
jgi:hypothetical protein